MVTKNRTKTKLVCKGFIDESPETQNALLDKMSRKRNKESNDYDMGRTIVFMECG